MRLCNHAEQILVCCLLPLSTDRWCLALGFTWVLHACSIACLGYCMPVSVAEQRCCSQDLPQEDKMALRMTAIDQVLGIHTNCQYLHGRCASNIDQVQGHLQQLWYKDTVYVPPLSCNSLDFRACLQIRGAFALMSMPCRKQTACLCTLSSKNLWWCRYRHEEAFQHPV